MYWRFRESRNSYHRLQDDTASYPRNRQWCGNSRRLNGLLLLYKLHTEQTALPTSVLAWITNTEHFGSCSKHWNVTFIFSAAMPANITIYFRKSIPTRRGKKKQPWGEGDGGGGGKGCKSENARSVVHPQHLRVWAFWESNVTLCFHSTSLVSQVG